MDRAGGSGGGADNGQSMPNNRGSSGGGLAPDSPPGSHLTTEAARAVYHALLAMIRVPPRGNAKEVKEFGALLSSCSIADVHALGRCSDTWATLEKLLPGFDTNWEIVSVLVNR